MGDKHVDAACGSRQVICLGGAFVIGKYRTSTVQHCCKWRGTQHTLVINAPKRTDIQVSMIECEDELRPCSAHEDSSRREVQLNFINQKQMIKAVRARKSTKDTFGIVFVQQTEENKETVPLRSQFPSRKGSLNKTEQTVPLRTEIEQTVPSRKEMNKTDKLNEKLRKELLEMVNSPSFENITKPLEGMPRK